MADKIIDAVRAAREINVEDICRKFLAAQGYSWDEFDEKSRAILKNNMHAALKTYALAPLDC